jgi:hypothetical protein
MPQTGPFTRSHGGKSFYKYQQWYRQQRPYKQPLPYRMLARKYSYGGNLTDSGSASALSYDVFSNPAYARAYNDAYADFKEKIGEAASLAVNVAERKQAIDAMTKRVTQVYRFARALKKFRFGEAAEALGLQVVTQTRTSVRVKRSETSKRSSWSRSREAERQRQKDRASLPDDAPVSGQHQKEYRPSYRKEDDTWELRLKRRSSAFGSNYLEFHFGWEPLMKDIVNTWDIFMDPMRDKYGLLVVGRGKASAKSATGNPSILFSTFANFSWGSRVSVRARVKINNIDLYRAEQLGLLNPAVLAWELVPFSFIVDWFANVGDYLASMTDFMGLDLVYPQSTHLGTIVEDNYYVSNTGPLLYAHYDCVTVERSTGISGPTLQLKALKGPSVTRGLTAVSLLAGFLGTAQHRR